MPPSSSSAAGGDVDAVVVGAGHDGLVAAAAVLADVGWDVLVLEAQPDPGGAVRSAELIPGYISDLYSAFYPMTLASPAMGALHLEDYGLRWSHAPAVVGHARSGPDDDAPVIYRDPATTAAELARHQRSDGDNWWRPVELWNTIKRRCSTPCSHRSPTARADSAATEIGHRGGVAARSSADAAGHCDGRAVV
ncbi:MAG: hypothetical protein QOI29_1309 [Mycobacterium sp.]|nr:hypothetical protein [Mycobacterium sp.]